MWIVVLIIGILAIIIYNSRAHDKEIREIHKKGTPELTPQAKELMSDFHKDFTKAYYNLLSTLSELHENSSFSTKNKVNFTLRQTAQFLNISADQADAYMHQHGAGELCEQLASIPKGAQLDSIISTAFGIAAATEGTIQGQKANEFALSLLLKIFDKAGISEDEVTASVEKTALLAQKFM